MTQGLNFMLRMGLLHLGLVHKHPPDGNGVGVAIDLDTPRPQDLQKKSFKDFSDTKDTKTLLRHSDFSLPRIDIKKGRRIRRGESGLPDFESFLRMNRVRRTAGRLSLGHSPKASDPIGRHLDAHFKSEFGGPNRKAGIRFLESAV